MSMGPTVTACGSEGRSAFPDPRTIRRALAVLERLPTEALADLTERLIARLDLIEPDADLELDDDRCDAADDGAPIHGDGMPGDADDSDGLPSRRLVMVTRYERGVPVRAQMMRLVYAL